MDVEALSVREDVVPVALLDEAAALSIDVPPFVDEEGCVSIDVLSGDTDSEVSEDLLLLQLNSNPVAKIKNNFFIIIYFLVFGILKVRQKIMDGL
ncbi:hypothetical protein GCM10007332_21000 [Epilithonimonas arachidiradicis]|uniref:Uncharacterized protein n=1 Tax=Epilithonimonas arachidiradicis TaxID=1617282 RepID=A0ABQ1X6Y3_9FLAO|nr:hypothetical protein GCM10007332_21000 [Epilithonimonas arachidiradicis]